MKHDKQSRKRNVYDASFGGSAEPTVRVAQQQNRGEFQKALGSKSYTRRGLVQGDEGANHEKGPQKGRWQKGDGRDRGGKAPKKGIWKKPEAFRRWKRKVRTV